MRVGLVLAYFEMFLLSRLVVSKGEEEGSNMNDSSSSSGSEVGEKEREGRSVSDIKMKLSQLEKMEERERKWELTVVGYDYVQCGVLILHCVCRIAYYVTHNRKGLKEKWPGLRGGWMVLREEQSRDGVERRDRKMKKNGS